MSFREIESFALDSSEEFFATAKLDFNECGNFAMIDYRGAITLSALNKSFDQLVRHPKFTFNMNALVDFTEASPEIEMPGIEAHALYVQQRLSLRGSSYQLAMVTDDALSNALLSVYKLLLARTQIEVEIFERKQAAIEWLLSV